MPRKSLLSPGVLAHERPNLPTPIAVRILPMNRRRKIYEGKAKDLYEGDETGLVVQYFKY
jgi:phosphoribosylaminoimidazole-succinocarboxamide synthase